MADNTTNIGLMGVDDAYEGVSLSSFLKTLYLNQQALYSEDMVLTLTPATLATTAAAATVEGFSRDVAIVLANADGDVLDYNDTFAIAVSNGSSSAGTVTIEDSASTVTLSHGVGSVTLLYAGTWAAEDVCTFTVTGGTVAGTTVADKTSVDTIAA